MDQRPPRAPGFIARAAGALVCDICGCVVSPLKADQDRHTAWHQTHEGELWPVIDPTTPPLNPNG